MDRREKILQMIQESEKPISASFLAKTLGVSRQIIVGDVALIRASGTNITATPRGYILEEKKNNYIMSVFKTGIYFGVAVCDVSTGEFYATRNK